jgi:hypothetical protein
MLLFFFSWPFFLDFPFAFVAATVYGPDMNDGSLYLIVLYHFSLASGLGAIQFFSL